MSDSKVDYAPPAETALALAELEASLNAIIDQRLAYHGLIMAPAAPRPSLRLVEPQLGHDGGSSEPLGA
jgi:hypothetical protein